MMAASIVWVPSVVPMVAEGGPTPVPHQDIPAACVRGRGVHLRFSAVDMGLKSILLSARFSKTSWQGREPVWVGLGWDPGTGQHGPEPLSLRPVAHSPSPARTLGNALSLRLLAKEGGGYNYNPIWEPRLLRVARGPAFGGS